MSTISREQGPRRAPSQALEKCDLVQNNLPESVCSNQTQVLPCPHSELVSLSLVVPSAYSALTHLLLAYQLQVLAQSHLYWEASVMTPLQESS
jgi:predicted class III extradiol MEMO1 family dioxygenase